MSDSVLSNISFSDYDDISFFADKSTEKPLVKDKKITILKIVVICLVTLLALEALLYTVVIPCLAPAKMECHGNKTLSSQEVIKILAEVDNQAWLTFDTQRAVNILSGVSCIESVSVEKQFPDKVIINLKERKSVAKTLVTMDGRTSAIQIDENGVLFSITSQTLSGDSNIPLITGLPVSQMQDGTRLPSCYRTLMEQISQIAKLPQKYFAAISEINVVPKDYGNFELVLYPIHSRVKVLLDSSLTEEALEYMIVTLDVVNMIELDVTEIDLRYGAVSYRTRQD